MEVRSLWDARWSATAGTDRIDAIDVCSYTSAYRTSNTPVANDPYIPSTDLCHDDPAYRPSSDIKIPFPPSPSADDVCVASDSRIDRIRFEAPSRLAHGPIVKWGPTAPGDRLDVIRWQATEPGDRADLICWTALVPVDRSDLICWDTQAQEDVIFDASFDIEQLPPPLDLPTILSTYKMANTVTVQDAGANDVGPLSFQLTHTLGEHSWKMNGQALTDITALINTNITVTINAEQWVIRVEEVTKVERFGRTEWALRGVSLTGLFNEPHEVPGSGSEASQALTSSIAQNIMQADATVTWTGANWTLDAGSYSYSNRTRLQAIDEIARASGQVIYPDKMTADFTVRPYHLVNAWSWAGATPYADYNRVDFLSITETKEQIVTYNGIRVNSKRAGASVIVRRLSTDGLSRLPEFSSPLLTDIVPGVAYGSTQLSRAYLSVQAQAAHLINNTAVSIPVGRLIRIDGAFYFVDGTSIGVQSNSRRVNQRLSLSAV